MIEKWVGSIVIQADPNLDVITFIFPAHRGQVIVSMKVNSVDIGAVIDQGLNDEEDVYAFMDAHRPWDSTTYIHWVTP